MSHKHYGKKRQGSFLSKFFTIVIVVCIVFIAGLWGAQKSMTDATRSGATAAPEPTAAPTAAPTDIPAQPTDTPTPQPTATPTALPTEIPTQVPTQAPAEIASSALVTPSPENAEKLASAVRPEVVEGFLPVCDGSVTQEKVYAITIDDCNQPDNLRKMVDLIASYGGHATIFPIGENVEMCKKVLKSAWEQGFEIENHTWSHCGLYNVDDDEMAAQIWRQNAAVSEALGVDYQMHFLRPRGGDNRYDQRTHAYMRQLGYYGIAYWTQVGLKVSAKYLDNHAQPGNIILYHTTDEDLQQLKELVPRLSREGYTFVTLNELYGLPANETAPLSDHSQVPALASYTRFPQILRREDYLHDVLLVQKRLSELGYLDENYNGYYGKDTEKAVRAFQQDNGLQADGLCGQATWNALFGGS